MNTNPVSRPPNEHLQSAAHPGTHPLFNFLISRWDFDASIFICFIIFYLLWFPQWPLNPFTESKLRKRLKNTRLGREQLKFAGVIVISALTWHVINLVQKYSGDSLKPIDCLAILGTVLAVVAWRESVQQNEEIHNIINSLPTRYLETFPHHLGDIITMVEKPKSSVKIIVDCADYGSFSNPDDHKRFVEAIKAIQKHNDKIQKDNDENQNGKRPMIKVDFRICGKPQDLSRSSQYWERWQKVLRGGEEEWKEFLKKRDFQKTLKAYCRFNKIDHAKYNHFKHKDDFIKLMTHKRNNVLDDWGLLRDKEKLGVSHLSYEHIEHLPGVFFWMKDDREAVFVLSHTRGGTQGMAFYTRDVQIIEILKTTWNSMRKLDKDGMSYMDGLENEEMPSITHFLTFFPPEKSDFIMKFLKKHKDGHTVD